MDRTTLYNHLRYSLLLPRICGSFMFNSRGELQYFQVCRIIVCSLGYLYQCHEFLRREIHFHDMVIIVYTLLDIAAALTLLCGCWRQEHLRKCLDALEKVSFYVNTSKFRTRLWPSIVSNILFFVVVLGKACLFPEPILKTVSFLFTILLSNSLSDELSSIMYFMGNLSNALTTRLIWTIRRDDLDLILKAQDLLCSSVRHFNHFYSLQILMLVALSFFGATTFCFIFLKTDNSQVIPKVISLLWLLCYLQLSFKVTLSASSLNDKMHAFDIHLYELLKTRPGCWKELVKVEDLLIDRTISISAAGFFELTIENFGSMVSTATTYLVILLQMD